MPVVAVTPATARRRCNPVPLRKVWKQIADTKLNMTRIVTQSDATRDGRLWREFLASGASVAAANTVLNPIGG